MGDKNWISFVEDINNALKLEPPYPTDKEEDALPDIASRQDGDDAFVDEDYLPQSKIGLKDSTVAWLIANDIAVPETWNKRLQRQKAKAENPLKATKKEKPVKEKAEKPVSNKNNKSKTKNNTMNALGHRIGSIAANLDDLFLKGVTEDDINKAGIDLGRAKGHFKHIAKDKANIATTSCIEGVYKVEMK